MRIAFVAPFGLRAKGTTRARALPLARALVERGHKVDLFIPPYDSPEDSGRQWNEAGVQLTNILLPEGGPDTGGLWHVHVAWRLLLAVRRSRPDVVHVFKPKGPSGLVGAALWLSTPRVAKGTRLRIVMDSDDWEGHGGWNDDPRAGYSPLERRFFAWQERYGFSHADSWTVTSACLQERAATLGAVPSRVFVLPNGVATSDTELPVVPEVRRRQAGAQVASAVLYTRFAGVRPEDVAGLWKRVRALLPEARLTVVGQGLAGEEKWLCDVPGIDLRGWLEPQARLAQFAVSHLAIVPWADTPSNRARHSAKVLELMAAGLPITAYAVGELPATLGDAGSLVSPGDEEGFARAVVKLFNDRELAEGLGTSARRRAETLFNWERLVEVVLSAYTAAGVRGSIWRPSEAGGGRDRA